MLVESRCVEKQAGADSVFFREADDLDKCIQLGDRAIEVAAEKGRTKAALTAMEEQRKARAVHQDERKRESAVLVALQAERASVTAKGRQIEAEAPIR